jgi:hypothetical protein
LPDIEGLPFGKPFPDIEKNNFIGYFTIGQNIGTGCAYVSGAYNGNFHRFALLKKRAAKRLLKGII